MARHLTLVRNPTRKTARPTPPPVVLDRPDCVVVEPRFLRWHRTSACAVLRAQPGVETVSGEDVEMALRPCTLCATPRADAPASNGGSATHRSPPPGAA